MEPESPAVPDMRRLNRGITVARVIVIALMLLPLVALAIGVAITSQANANPADDPALYETIQNNIYGSVVISCLLIPLVVYIGMSLTFRKRAITQQIEHGRIFLTAMIIWLMYAFLTVALFILWNLTPGM